ncbi:GNAT family N-acetyltransferase [Streptomyces roseolus]|uniref:GNAT family N-acetyltransferase n=1 Tax=Streptomyces roseolus TaxID=67358 RepID=UPI003666D98B
MTRADPERLGRCDAHRARQRWRDGSSPAPTPVIGAGGDPAGCVTLRPDPAGGLRPEHSSPDPALRGRCPGTAVPGRLLERADAAGETVRLAVLRDGAARRLHERAGFVREAEDGVDVFLVRPPVSPALPALPALPGLPR